MSGPTTTRLVVEAPGYDRHETLVCELLDGGARVSGWAMGVTGAHTLDLAPGSYAVRVTTGRGTSSVHPFSLGTAGAHLSLGAGGGELRVLEPDDAAGGGTDDGGGDSGDGADVGAGDTEPASGTGPPSRGAEPPTSGAEPPTTDLPFPAPPPEWLIGRQIGVPTLTTAGPIDLDLDLIDDPDLLALIEMEERPVPTAPPPVRRRAWRRLSVTLFVGEGPTSPLTPEPVDPTVADADVVVDLEAFHTPGRYAVRVVGPAVAARIVHLPPSWGFGVHLGRGPQSEDGVSVAVSGRSSTAAALMAQLGNGQLDAASAIGDDLAQRARALFQQKQASAEGAAAAGYFLIRAGRVADIGDWPHRFAELFPWLPDAHVVLAAAELEREEPDLAVVRSCVLAAASWVPCYTEGLRLLHRQVELLRSTLPDAEVDEAAERVRALAAACDWRAVATTYWGERPGAPTLDPPRLDGLSDRDGEHLEVVLP